MKKETILCVDDEKIILDSLKSQLRRNFGNQFSYEFAMSANEALELIEELDADEIKIIIIVSDWLMPGIKGDEFLIKVNEKFPKIVKIMITGQANNESIENAYKNANLFKCFPKPWKEEELVRTIINALEALKNE